MEVHSQLLLAVAIFVCALLVLWWQRQPKEDYPYELQDGILTDAELAFYHVLLEAVPPGISIFCKPRIADVLKVRSGLGDSQRWQRAFNKINAKHFDFVLCEQDSFSYLAAIELNDSSHELPQRQQRDYFVTQACQAAGLPLLMYPWQQDYDIVELQDEIDALIG